MVLYWSLLSQCVFLTVIYLSSCARILGVFNLPSYSHYAAPSVLLKELAQRGHEITVLSPLPQKSTIKNFQDIELTGVFESFRDDNRNPFDFVGINAIISEIGFHEFLLRSTEDTLKHRSVQDLLKSDATFDLVLIEDAAGHALKGFCYHYNTPCIMVNSMGLTRLTNSQVGNPYFPSFMPDFSLPYSSSMTFIQRLHNAFVYLFAQLHQHLYVMPRHNEILRKYFPGSPHLDNLYYNVSLSFVNSHVSTHQPLPYVPNVIEIGGIHIEPPKQLPKDIQDYLDDAEDGVVFFSMGSNIKSTQMPTETREAVLKTFSKLKQRVLWKWEDEDLPGKPSNVKISKWLPQSDILAHPNVKLFITHGGLLSQIEAVYHGVPVLGIPLYGDQKMNMANAEYNGIGLMLPYAELCEETFSEKMQQVLTNPMYRERAQMRSKIMQDQAMTPLERAVFWVEYILRHDGAFHLQTAALNLNWYQYLLLDVIGFLLLSVIITVFIFYHIFKKIFTYIKNLGRTNKVKVN